MRILHISTRLILGGSQENTVLSCEGQARRGHEVHLAYGPIFGPEGSLLERVQRSGGTGERGSDGKIHTHEVPHLVREISPRADWKCYRELRALIREINPDVVHTHSSKAGVIGRAAAWSLLPLSEGRGRGVGSLRPMEGAPAQGLPMTMSEPTPGPSLGEGRRRMAVVHTVHGPPFHANLPWRTNRLYVAAERFAARRCHAIIGVCNAMVEQFVEHRIGRPEQYHTVYSGMEVERYLHAAPSEGREEVRARLGLRPNDFVIGTVARLAEHKGHDDVLEALAEDLRAHPEWKLLWVGDGWWRQRLIDKARAAGVAVAELDSSPPHPPHPPTIPAPSTAQLILTGLVPPERIAGLVRSMDVLVHPSYREGLPRTVPQALLCGTCPIAYDTDGTPEVCKEMKTGRLVRTGDKAGLRGAVLWASENEVARRLLAARGREDCKVRFSAEKMVDELERVYVSVLRAPIGEGTRR